VGVERLVDGLDLGARAGEGTGSRPYLALNMISSTDGRATLGGRSGALGGRADSEMLHALRTTVDAVMAGAGTVRAERYSRLVCEEHDREIRRARGLAEEPLICVVSGRLALNEEIPLLADPDAHVAMITASQASLPRECRARIEYIRAAREGVLDLPAAMRELRERFGVRTVLCEGGPHLNSQLLAGGLVDELFLTLAPKLAGGDATSETLRIVSGPELEPPAALELLGASEHESYLFLRYRVIPS
jgi:riboflavin-specific deaminase-like protein